MLRSPQELYDKAVEIMLDGKTPANHEDWSLIINFWACNISYEVQPSAIYLMAMIFDCPIGQDEIYAICEFQHRRN